MLFKVQNKVNGMYWTWYMDEPTVLEKYDAFVFNSNNPTHMDNVLMDFNKALNVLKLVRV